MPPSDLAGSVLVYSGLLAFAVLALGILLGGLRWFRFLRIRRLRRRIGLAGLGVLAIAAGLAVPNPLARAAAPAVRLDAFLPEFQFHERHETTTAASPAAIRAAIWGVTAREIRLFRLFTWIRSPRWPGRSRSVDILSAPADRPILESALAGGFRTLADTPREVVLGTLILPRRAPALAGRDIGELRGVPGVVLAAVDFRIEPLSDSPPRCRVTTETRVFATDPRSFRRFQAYWRLIAPGSAILRVTWLDAIRRRAEGSPGG